MSRFARPHVTARHWQCLHYQGHIWYLPPPQRFQLPPTTHRHGHVDVFDSCPRPWPGRTILRVGKAACHWHSEHASRPISLDHHTGEHLKLAGPGAAVVATHAGFRFCLWQCLFGAIVETGRRSGACYGSAYGRKNTNPSPGPRDSHNSRRRRVRGTSLP